MKGKAINEDVKGRRNSPEMEKIEGNVEKAPQDTGGMNENIVKIEADFTDISSKKVIINKDRTPQKQRSFNISEGSSSSESRSPANGDPKRSHEIDASLKIGSIGKHPNNGREDIALGNSKREPNWAELLFKNEGAQKVEGEVRTGDEGLPIPVGKDPSGLEEGELENKETGLSLNQSKTPTKVNFSSVIPDDHNVTAVRSLGERSDPRTLLQKEGEEALRIDQGEDEPFTSSDQEENWSRAERIQDKSITKKERKRRDRAAHKEKQLNIGAEVSELSGRSLSESDLIEHKETLIKRAKRFSWL
ncbi:hypothetical protein V6N12_010252 [Hibiscus sabdariffa]|uniref:Uncharacterized protein n=1 Tax=Hibiscus sabdariffa TaxID=183260 RepID=A0ABR2B4A6_9ROSI